MKAVTKSYNKLVKAGAKDMNAVKLIFLFVISEIIYLSGFAVAPWPMVVTVMVASPLVLVFVYTVRKMEAELIKQSRRKTNASKVEKKFVEGKNQKKINPPKMSSQQLMSAKASSIQKKGK